MDYELQQLIDLSKFKTLFNLIYETTGVPSGLVDFEGNILVQTGWRDICTKFHRVNPYTKARCMESDKFVFKSIAEKEKILIRKCQNGLMDIGMPITIRNKQLATLFQGQFFMEEPNIDFFINQAKRFGFDEEEYIKALKEVPVIPKERIQSIITLVAQFASIIVDMGLKQLELIESNKKLTEQNEKIKENEKLKLDFFANISHELRTPVNVIFSAAQVMDKNLDDSQWFNQKNTLNRYSHIIKQNCYRLIRLTNNLIDVTKIDANFINLNLTKCNIVEVVEDIVLSVVEFTKSKGIELIFDTESEEKIIFCDVDKIERIMLNLISNAIKYNNDNGAIKVSVFDIENGVLISVKDNGTGISEDKQKTIFNRFVRGEELLVRSAEGSGIGLSLCRDFVEMHGGTISVRSTPGKGSEFKFSLPSKIDEKQVIENDEADKQGKPNNIEKVAIEFSDIYKIQG